MFFVSATDWLICWKGEKMRIETKRHIKNENWNTSMISLCVVIVVVVDEMISTHSEENVGYYYYHYYYEYVFGARFSKCEQNISMLCRLPAILLSNSCSLSGENFIVSYMKQTILSKHREQLYQEIVLHLSGSSFAMSNFTENKCSSNTNKTEITTENWIANWYGNEEELQQNEGKKITQ